MNKTIETPDKWVVEEYPTVWSGVRIFRTRNSGGHWYFSAWISEEQKYYKKSLKTKDLSRAVQLGEEEFLNLKIKARTGEKIFACTVQELIDWYIEVRSQDVTNNLITAGRLGTIRSMLKAVSAFLGADSRVNSFTGDKFKEYTNFRLQTASLVTVKNERSTINSMFKEAFEAGKVSHLQMPKWEKLGRIPVETRNPFTPAEYRRLYTGMRSWVKDCDPSDQKIRAVIQEFILISANTGIRFGEMRRLKWRHVDRLSGENAEITLPWDITKNKKERTVVGKCGDYLRRLSKTTNHSEPNDFLFADPETGKELVRDVYYKQWESLMGHVGLNANPEVRPLTYYSLRHTYATFRLLYGNVNPHLLARNMGTSLTFLENHYSHVRTPEMVDELTRTVKSDKSAFRMVEEAE